MTEKQKRALEILGAGARYPDEFYVRMWPEGRWTRTGGYVQGGGPNRAECAANWYLGRLRRKGWVGRFQGRWHITPKGAELWKSD